MAYNIDSVEIVSSENFRISVGDVRKARRRIERLPEDCVIRYLVKEIEQREREADADLPAETELPLIKLAWRSESSGSTYDDLLDVFLPLTKGRADIIFTWEGGDSFSGIRVVDGKVERRRVVRALGDIEGS